MKRYRSHRGLKLPKAKKGSKESRRKYNHAYYMKVTRRKK